MTTPFPNFPDSAASSAGGGASVDDLLVQRGAAIAAMADRFDAALAGSADAADALAALVAAALELGPGALSFLVVTYLRGEGLRRDLAAQVLLNLPPEFLDHLFDDLLADTTLTRTEKIQVFAICGLDSSREYRFEDLVARLGAGRDEVLAALVGQFESALSAESLLDMWMTQFHDLPPSDAAIMLAQLATADRPASAVLLIAESRHEAPEVRAAVAGLLGAFATESARELLGRLAADEAPEVREAAAVSLSAVSASPVAPDSERAHELREALHRPASGGYPDVLVVVTAAPVGNCYGIVTLGPEGFLDADLGVTASEDEIAQLLGALRAPAGERGALAAAPLDAAALRALLLGAEDRTTRAGRSLPPRYLVLRNRLALANGA